MLAKITDHFIDLEGAKYFVGQASGILFGGYGEKLTPIGFGKLNYLNQWDTIPGPRLAEIKVTATELTVEFADKKGIDLFAGIKVPGLASGNVKLSVADFSGGKVKLVKISQIGDKDQIEAINNSPAVKKKLIDFDGKARVVESILIAIEATLYSKFSATLSTKAAVIVDGVMVRENRSGDMSHETTVSVGTGTCIGYSLNEPKWNATLDKNKTQVESLRLDQQGL